MTITLPTPTSDICDITLYAIIDPERVNGRNASAELAALSLDAVSGGATILQYRDKHGSTRNMIQNAKAILQAIEETKVPLLINDRVDVALAIGAHGVHVGQDDMPVTQARRLLGENAIIGLSIKTDENATSAPTELLDYVCIGGVFDTASKDNKSSIGVSGWQRLASRFHQSASGMPVGAIAGIDHENAASLISAGADGVAIISALFLADDVRTSTERMSKIIQAAKNVETKQ